METRANYVIVGIFTLAALAAAAAFVYWRATSSVQGEVAMLQLRVQGSAFGIARGSSAVLFNGVKVGEINRVYIDFDDPAVAVVESMVERRLPITTATRAEVSVTGLTGQANIELRGGDPTAPNLFDLADEAGEIASIATQPSPFTNLMESAQGLFDRADAVLLEVEGFAVDARGPLTQTLRNVEDFSAALGRNADGIGTFLESVTAMSSTLLNVSGQIESSLAAVEQLIAAVDGDKVAATLDNIEQFTRRLDEASGGFDEIMAGATAAVDSVAQFTASANETLARVDSVVASVDPEAVRATIGNVQEASAGIGAAVGDVARVAQAFSARADDIDGIITDARQLAARLNQASERVDTVLARVDDLLGSDGAQTVITEAGETLRAFRDTAATLNARIDAIAGGLLGSDEEDGVIAEVAETLQAFRGMAATLDERVGAIADGLVGAGEEEGVIAEINETLRAFREAATTLDTRVDAIAGGLLGEGEGEGVIAEASETLRAFREAATSLNARVDAIAGGLLGAGEEEGVIAEANETLRAFREVADTLNTRVDRVMTRVDDLLGSGDVDGVVAEASETLRAFREVADTLNRRVDGVLDEVEGLLGSGEARGVIAEASETLQAFREVAVTLNARMATITDGLARFSGQGLREVEALVRDSRRSITRIEQAITDLERNPQRILSGGAGGVREFDGRTRR